MRHWRIGLFALVAFAQVAVLGVHASLRSGRGSRLAAHPRVALWQRLEAPRRYR